MINWIEIIRPGFKAIREHWRPFVFIQCMAIALVVAYYRWTAFREFCEHIVVWRTQAGFLFPMFTSAVAGAILPEIAKVITTGDLKFPLSRWRSIGFHFSFFAVNGLLVDYFYKTQAILFGSGIDAATLIKKMLVDMFGMTPFVFIPFGITAFLWRQYRYDVRRTLMAWNGKLYWDRVVPVLVPNWIYWIPMVLCIYALPSPLQFCLFLFAFAAWSLIFISLATDETRIQHG